MRVTVNIDPPLVYPPRKVSDNSGDRNVYEDGCEIALLRLIGNSLNISLDIVDRVHEETDEIDNDRENVEVILVIHVGLLVAISLDDDNSNEYTRSYFSVRTVRYTTCAVKYQRWSRFFSILSVDM
jgi:hypothetical protein